VTLRIGFYNDFPSLGSVPSIDDETVVYDICAMSARMLDPSQIHLIELAVLHAFEKMRTELKLPRPPFGPLMRADDSSARSSGSQVLPNVSRLPAAARRLHAAVGCSAVFDSNPRQVSRSSA
jgi:hypothetical protein